MNRTLPAFVALLSAAVGPAIACTDDAIRRLIDSRLDEREVRLLSISDRAVTYEDARGLLRHEPITEFLALLPGGSMAAPIPPMGTLTLHDGRRFIGGLVPAGAGADAIAWSHPTLGVFTAPLDRIRSLRFVPGSPGDLPPPEGDDRTTLINADILSGFVESIEPGGIDAPGELRLEVAGAPRAIRLDRVAAIDFASPRVPARGTSVWLRDGSIIAVREIIVSRSGEAQIILDEAGRMVGDDEGDASMSAPAGALPAAAIISSADISAIAFNEGELIALATLERTAETPMDTRRWTEGVTRGGEGVLGACDLTLPGPMRVRWALPDAAVRVCAWGTLPPAMWMWGDCELVVSESGAFGERELFRERLWSGRPSARFNIALTRGTARELEVRVEPGNYGPIQDRVILERAFVLMERPSL